MELYRHRFACTVTFDEQTHSGSELQPGGQAEQFTPWVGKHGVNPRVPLGLEFHFGPVRHEWRYLHSPQDH